MAEITHDHVYDAAQSTLVTLKELSAIAVALKIWHCEMNKYRTNDKLEEFNSKKLLILRTKNPDLPTAIDTMIRKYASEFGLSVDKWLKRHHKRVLHCHYSHRNYILEHFDGFVCDYDGAIDYIRTAERMMCCDKFGQVEKFKISCTYFFEDNVRRIWPFIRKNIGLGCIDFRDCPELYYWVCCLRNELNKIPINRNAGNNTVDEEMLDNCMPYNRSSVEYFWNRIPYQSQVRKALRLHKRGTVTFIKFTLPKFDAQQLDEFVNNEDCDLMHILLKHERLNEGLIGQTWMRIRNIINDRNFTKLVVEMFEFYKNKLRFGAMDKNQLSENWVHLCREIWCSAPHDLRRSAIENISSDFWRAISRDFPTESLLIVLTWATTEERSLFWSKCWPNLIECKNTQELQQIMEICFENSDAIIQYKENVMASNSEHLQDLCRGLLSEPDFEKLNDFVNFCFPNEDAARLFKHQSLESNFLRKNPVFGKNHFGQAAKFNEFINNTYYNTTLATNFKSHLLSLPEIRCFRPRPWYSKIELSKQLIEFTKFIETFVSTERKLKRIKMLVINHWKEDGFIVQFSRFFGFSHECARSLDQFLLWCLESDEEVGKFKQTYALRWCTGIDARCFASSRVIFYDFDQFLLWCLGSEEEVGKFKQTHFRCSNTRA